MALDVEPKTIRQAFVQHFTHFSAKIGVNSNGILPWIARFLFTVASTGCTTFYKYPYMNEVCGRRREPAFWNGRVRKRRTIQLEQSGGFASV